MTRGEPAQNLPQSRPAWAWPVLPLLSSAPASCIDLQLATRRRAGCSRATDCDGQRSELNAHDKPYHPLMALPPGRARCAL